VTVPPSTPRQRAAAASARIEAALDRLNPDQINATPVQLGTVRGVIISQGSLTLFGIAEGDLPQDTALTLESAGAQAVDRLQTLLRDRTEQRRWPVVLRGLAEAGLATLVFGVAWLVCGSILRRLRALLTSYAGQRLTSASIAEIDPRPVVYTTLGWLTHVVGLALLLSAGYVWITFVLSRFAYSLPWAQALGALLLNTLSRVAATIVDQLPNLVMLGIVVLMTRAVAAAVGAWFKSVERGDLSVTWLDSVSAQMARRLAVVAIWLFAFAVAYPFVPGANTEAFKGVSVFVGLLVSLGSAGVVGQIISGLFLTFRRALRPGDVVRIGDVGGIVKEMGMMSVTLVTREREEVTLSNSSVIGEGIKNFSRAQPGTVALSASVAVGYDTPWRQVRAMLLMAAARTDGVLSDPAPAVLQNALANHYVEYELLAHGTPTVPRPFLVSRLHEQILDVFNEHGVQIMTPSFEGQPDRRLIVERRDWFAAPAAAPEEGAAPASRRSAT
jgi:small-conductance mechanosensitive channel